MRVFDFIIVGAGSAGCVLADRLTRDGRHSVLLVEAGPVDSSPLIRMPKGIGKLLDDPRHVWRYPIAPEPGGPNMPAYWLRGRTLGGSSSVNGMVYVRGDPSDYEAWAEAGLTGWNWQSMSAAFAAIEDHQLGAESWRGAGGPLHVSMPQHGNPVCDALLAAGRELGIPAKPDLNDPNGQQGLGYYPLTIKNGRRWSAADAFLKPARRRSNLTVVTGFVTDRILFDGRRAVGVAGRGAGGPAEFGAGRAVILAAGTLNTPKLMQLSGIGAAETLQAAGIEVRLDRPAVGAHLREHRVLFMQFGLKRAALSHNREFRGLRLFGNVLKYALSKRGVMALGAFEAGGFVKTRTDLALPDAQLLMSPFSLNLGQRQANSIDIDAAPGAQCIVLPLRPTSEGLLAITAADPEAPLDIRPNFLATEADRRAAVGGVRTVRALFGRTPLQALVTGETTPGSAMQSDDEILSAFRQFGGCGYHAVGTCRMGTGEEAVTDPRLRVCGIDGLRIVDCSVMPTIPSGNTNGPVMALAWRAADLILEDA